MNSKDGIRQIDFDHVNDIPVDYMDEGIAFHTDIRELPIAEGSMRVNMFAIIACKSGKLQVELNTQPYTLRHNEILVCRPNDVIDNCMLSLDFDGAVLCMSQRGILKQISESELWEKTFQLAKNPIVRIGSDSLRMFGLFGTALMEKIKMERTSFYREIIVSIVKAALYELLANVDDSQAASCGTGLITQREVLFKRFIDLLSKTRIKPRYVSWYADQLCITPKYLSTISRQVSGKTAFDWITEYVLVDIRFWLKNSDKTIKEVADLLDFPSISFFGKYCRTHIGTSPTEYRKQLRNIPAGNEVD